MKIERLLAITAAALTWAIADPAVAVEVTHNGSDVFLSGGFENDAIDALPTNATLGTWDYRSNGGAGNPVREATFGPASAGPGAAVGNNYARLGLNGDGDTTIGAAGIAAVLGGQTTGTLESTFSLYLDEVLTGTGLQLQMNYMGPSNFSFPDRVTWVGAGHPDEAPGALGLPDPGISGAAPMAFYDGAWIWVTTGGGASVMSIPYNTWVNVTASVDLDNDTHTITVAGTTSDSMAAIDAAANGFSLMTNFDVSLAGNFYIDGPEGALIPGDVDGDGEVTIDDFNIILMNYGMTDAGRSDGDLTFDSVVDLFDFKEWKTNAGDLGAGMSIPEPGAITLLFVATMLLVGSGRRRHASR